MKERMTKRVNLCYKSLGNLSLLKTTHEIIWKVENLNILHEQLTELKEKIQSQNMEFFDMYPDRMERYLSCLRIISNCLVSDETLLTFELKDYQE